MNERFELYDDVYPSKDGYEKAKNRYKELINGELNFHSIRLVRSDHPYSEGYWIEFNKTIDEELSPYDYIIIEQDFRQQWREKQINKIL